MRVSAHSARSFSTPFVESDARSALSVTASSRKMRKQSSFNAPKGKWFRHGWEYSPEGITSGYAFIRAQQV